MTKEFFYKIKDFRQKCNTNFNFLLIFIVVLGGYVCIRSSYEFVIFSISIISLGITVGFVYINTVKNKILVKKISNIKKIYFLSLIIGVVIVLVILTLLKKDSMEEVFFLLSLRATLEYSQIENIFNVENKYISNIGIHIIAIVLYVSITLINFKNISIEAIFSDLKLKEIAYISILISLCVALSTLRKILSNRKKISKNEFKKVILYITSIMLNLSGLIFIKLDLNIISKVLLILKCTTFTLFYGYMIDKIRYECFNIINSNIEQAIKEKKHLNSILLKRNKILNDINTMINRTQNNYSMLLDSIYGGVFLFVGNKLQHVNNTMIKKMNMKSSDFVGMDIGVFLKKYCNLSLDEVDTSKHYSFFIDENIVFDMFFSCPDDENKLIYVQDFSYKEENKKIRKEFEECLADDKNKKEFFANISHELKTPINLISSVLQLNKIYLKENKIDLVDNNRKIIIQNCLRLIRTINNFIDSNKISEGYVIPDKKIYNIVDIIENTVLACNKYIKRSENTLIFDSQQEEIYVNCDKDFITRIILNLLSNSVKYGKKGGMIKVNLALEDDKVCIIIKNDGPKIEKDIIPYIFDRFTKLNKAFNRIKEGSGLGLFMTKALVEIQGGSIGLISNNEGNEFVITMNYLDNVEKEQIQYENFEMNSIDEKVDIEFSDIYIT